MPQGTGPTQRNLVLPVDFLFPLMAASAVFLGEYDKAYNLIIRGNPRLASDANDVVDRFNVGPALMLAYVQQKRGQMRDAMRLLAQAEVAIQDQPRLGSGGHGIRDVQIAALQGRKELALDRMRDAVDAGFVSLSGFSIWSLDVDPLTETLRGDPRFQAILEEIGQRIDVMRQNVEAAEASGDWESLRSRVESS